MVELSIFAVFLLALGLIGIAGELWAYIQDRHEKAAQQRIRARRLAHQVPREKERVDYWAA